jgi:hypothetical protein
MSGFLLSRGQFFEKNFNLTLRGLFVQFLGDFGVWRGRLGFIFCELLKLLGWGGLAKIGTLWLY